MKVTTDACVFGAWCAQEIASEVHQQKKMLDIGTGTGLISLMIWQKCKLPIDAVEIDEQAAEQAIENVKLANAAPIQVHHSDILKFGASQYHYIVSNPPFYEDDLASPSPTRSVAHHDGGLHLNDLFRIIADKLVPDGSFFLLLPHKRVSEIDALLKTHSLFIQKKIALQHSARHPASRVLIKGTKKYAGITEMQLAIKEGEDYSATFTNLLKDYYLYL